MTSLSPASTRASSAASESIVWFSERQSLPDCTICPDAVGVPLRSRRFTKPSMRRGITPAYAATAGPGALARGPA